MHQAQILLREGYSRSTVATILGVSRRTVYNYENNIVFNDGTRLGRPAGSSKLAPFLTHIDTALENDFTLNADLLFQKLQRNGYTGKISILRDYISKKRKEMHNVAVRRFETLPGQQAQVDWMHIGTVTENGRSLKRYAFIMKLGYSRRSFVEFTTSMEQSVLFACMIHAFKHFGGVPSEILFDNMKTAFIYNGGECRWQVNVKMASFAAHYAFTPRRCKAYRPKTKGKVEREVRYIRTSFLPSVGSDLSKVPTARLNELVELWMERVDQKVIRDFGQTRAARFEEEKNHLHALPDQPYEYRLPELLVVNREGKLIYKTNRYSMPSEYLGKQLEGLLDLTDHKLTLKYNGTVIRTLVLEADGAKNILNNPEDQREHYNAWLEGCMQEERVRKQVFEKRKRAEIENATSNPAVYDSLFISSESEERQEVAA
jgi:transposase